MNRNRTRVPAAALAQLDNSRVRDLIEHYERTRRERTGLRVGFRANVIGARLRSASELNRVYSSLVWGYCDNSYLGHIDPVERRFLSAWLRKSVWRASVLEVGCGSGRLTRFLVTLAGQVTAIDRDMAIIARARARLARSRSLKLRRADLLDMKGEESFSAVLLLENMLGMNPRYAERAELLNRAVALLRPGGLLVVGFRVMKQPRGAQRSFQIVPYVACTPERGRVRVFGSLITWSRRGFERELASRRRGLRVLQITPGARRRVGGRMYYVLAIKDPLLSGARV